MTNELTARQKGLRKDRKGRARCTLNILYRVFVRIGRDFSISSLYTEKKDTNSIKSDWKQSSNLVNSITVLMKQEHTY